MAKKFTPHLGLMFLSLALVMFFIITSGGCGGGHSGSGGSDTAIKEALSNKTFESSSGATGTGTAKDADGKSVDVTVSDVSVTFTNVTTATLASVQTAATTATVTLSYTLTINGTSKSYGPETERNVEINETSSGVYAFQFGDLSLTVDSTAGKTTFAGKFTFGENDTEYTVSKPIEIKVEDVSNPAIPTNPVPESESAAAAETLLKLDKLAETNSIGLDNDDNGIPDLLDFYGISQIHVNNSNASVTAASERVLVADDAQGVNVPSMIWLNRLNTEAEGGNIFIVPLTAGQEYTFEVSKNLTEDLGGILPNVSFYDPSNAYSYLDEAEELSNVTIAAYPKENPSIICYTIKPEVSGNYIVKITNGEPYSGAYLDDNGNLAHYSEEKTDTGSVLFIYKERRNEKNETGYYTRFKFEVDGKTTGSISINDIIELRKIFLDIYPNYFKNVYGQDLADDYEGKGGYFDWADFDESYFNNKTYTVDEGQIEALEKALKDDAYFEDYAVFMEEVLANVGVVALYSAPYEALDKDDSLDYLSDEELEARYEKAYPDSKLTRDILERAVYGSSLVSTSDLKDEWSSLPADIMGIPYEPRYYMGRGAMAFTMLDPPGATTIRLNTPPAPTATQTRLMKFDEATSDDLMKKANLTPTANDTDAAHPITTDFYTKFINTASQTEQLTKTTANVSLATSALGLSAGTGSTNNFKFGLTSSTFVIHYEETELDYRELPSSDLYGAWEGATLFEAISEDYETDKSSKDAPKFISEFRNDYGDYYVSGYQYGACYDAYIAITTQTSEQLEEVESKLGANLNIKSFSASADLSSTTKDTLKENKATIDVRIVTTGFGNNVPTVYPPTPGLKSGDVGAIDDVFKSLSEFLGKIGGNNRASYAPVRVKMTRWKADPKISRLMRKKGYRSGNIPVTIGQSQKIGAFNTKLKSLRGYRNVVTGNSAINASVVSNDEAKFSALITQLQSAGDRFYQDENKTDFENTEKEVDELITKFKSLADRYTFYTKLVIAQKQEKETYDKLKSAADKAGEGTATAYANVRQMPFGDENGKGGESGYDEYGVSEYVTEDINAGKEISADVHVSRSKAAAYRLEWTHQGTQKDFPGAKPASLTATTTDGSDAIFCKVWARSTNADSKDDRAREIATGAPAVGRRAVGFYFKSGYSSSVDWEIIGKSMRMRTADYPFVGLTK